MANRTLLTYSWHFDEVNTLSEMDALHADWLAVDLARSCLRLGLGDACKLLASINQAWGSIGILTLFVLLRSG